MAHVKVKFCNNKGSSWDEKDEVEVPARTVHRLGQYSEQGLEKAQVFWGKSKQEIWNCVILEDSEKEEAGKKYVMLIDHKQ